MRWLLRTGAAAYHAGIRTAARFGHSRARQWVRGRQTDPAPAIEALHAAGRPVAWVHAASLGEFEQARPVMVELRAARPEWAFVLTFFSPSGYERSKHTDLAEVVSYLPPDSARNARAWVATLRPVAAIFAKYEFWYDHLTALRGAGVPTFLIAGSFRAGQPFFRPYGSGWREMLRCFTHFAVQTQRDARLLADLGLDNVTVTGDPRLDRTAGLAESPFTDDRLAAFTADAPTLMAGSVWPADVSLFAAAWPRFRSEWKLVLAPHQLDEAQLEAWQKTFVAERYTGKPNNGRVLLLDTIGMLSRSYRYGTLAYVGGAFGSGLHNTLEPLSYGLPVIFGPAYHKFPEAVTALERGGAYSIQSVDELEEIWSRLAEPRYRERATAAQLAYRDEQRGAGRRTAQLILRLLACLLLLTGHLEAQSWEPADRVLRTLDGLYAKCSLMEALSGVTWRPGLCLAAVELERGATASLELDLTAGTRYYFIAGGDGSAGDVDLYLRDSTDRVVADDRESDATPVVEYLPTRSGSYRLQLHLAATAADRQWVAIGLLREGGGPIADLAYRQVSREFGVAAGAVRAAGGATRFGSGANDWSVYGYLLGAGGSTTLENLSLPRGKNFLAATGTENIRDIDIFLATTELRIVRRDQEPDSYPMIEYDQLSEDPLLLRLEVESAAGTGLILLGLFTR